jgi:hypothetical protein
MDNSTPALFSQLAGAWVALGLALVLFSTLLGDHRLGRLAQHVLIGAALGYAALVAVRELLLPRVATALAGNGGGWVWLPLLLGLLLWLAGADAMRGAHSDQPLPRWRAWLRLLGLIPVALMLGVGITVALLGVLQGTLLPQVGTLIARDVDLAAPPVTLATGILTLLLTTATLLHLTWGQGRTSAGRPLFAPLAAWRWIGVRALWVGAGVLFARLAVARVSLLIGWLEFVLQRLRETGLWQWVEFWFG